MAVCNPPSFVNKSTMVSNKRENKRKRFRQMSLMNVVTSKKNMPKDESLKKVDDAGMRRSRSVPSDLNLSIRSSPMESDRRVDHGGNDLSDLYVIDCKTCERLYPNERLHHIDNELCSGYMYAMVPTSANKTHFAGKKRKIELQFQIKFKQVPDEQIHVGMELNGALKMGIWQRTVFKGILTVIERRNPLFHYNISGCEFKVGDEFTRKPFLSMPFETSLNALVITKEGDMPPAIGESLDKERRRLSIGDIEFNTSDTYTFAMWSGYVNLLEWRCNNIAPVQPSPLESIIGDNAFVLNFYTRGESSYAKKHSFSQEPFMGFEFSHAEKSRLGSSKKGWLQSNASPRDIEFSSHHFDEDQGRDDVETCESSSSSSYYSDFSSSCLCWGPF